MITLCFFYKYYFIILLDGIFGDRFENMHPGLYKYQINTACIYRSILKN